MTEQYIDRHLDGIRSHACDAEARLKDGDYTADSLKADNRKVLEGFRNEGEKVVLIDGSYEQAVTDAIRNLLCDVKKTGKVSLTKDTAQQRNG